jgi:hypothetical protein
MGVGTIVLFSSDSVTIYWEYDMTITISPYRIPNGMPTKLLKKSLSLLESRLEAAELSGTFMASPRTQIRVRSPEPLRVTSINTGQIRLKLKPGDNTTAWEWFLTPPADVEPEDVASRLDPTYRPSNPLPAIVQKKAAEQAPLGPSDTSLEELHATLKAQLPPVSPPAARKAVKPEKPTAPPPTLPPAAKAPPPPDPQIVREQVAPPPPLAASETPLAPPTSRDARLRQAQEAAAGYAKRLEEIARVRTEITACYAKIEELEDLVLAMDKEASKDAAGKEAYEKLKKIDTLLEML